MHKWLFPSVVLGFALVGCGGGSGEGLTTTQFCAQKAAKECQVAARCAVDMTACLTERQSVCEAFVAAQTVAPRVFRPANVAACINKTDEIYAKTAPITPTDLATMDDVCANVFQGDVKLEKPCTVKYDCEGSLICDKGLCVRKVVKNKGDQCGNAGEICVAGAFCTMSGPVTKCEDKKMLGDACDDATPCIEALRCDGTCKERVAADQSCNSSDDCAAAAPYCDPSIGNRCYLGLLFAARAPACAAFGGSVGGTGGTADAGSDVADNDASAD